MEIHALSVVSPWGMRIAEGRKTLEIRSWRPPTLPIENLLIVENERRLLEPEATDPEGRAVAVVGVREVRPWTPADADAACSDYEAGWLAWVLENVRPIARPFQVPAKRRLYRVEIPDGLWVAGMADLLSTFGSGAL